MYWMKSPRVQAGVYGAIMALRRVAAIKAAGREMVRSAGLERAGSRSLGALDLGHVLARRDLSLDFYPFLPLWAPTVFASPAIDEPDAAPPTRRRQRSASAMTLSVSSQPPTAKKSGRRKEWSRPPIDEWQRGAG
jgi:hypothetical protein